MLGPAPHLDGEYTLFGEVADLRAFEAFKEQVEALPTRRDGIFVMPVQRIEVLSSYAFSPPLPPSSPSAPLFVLTHRVVHRRVGAGRGGHLPRPGEDRACSFLRSEARGCASLCRRNSVGPLPHGDFFGLGTLLEKCRRRRCRRPRICFAGQGPRRRKRQSRLHLHPRRVLRARVWSRPRVNVCRRRPLLRRCFKSPRLSLRGPSAKERNPGARRRVRVDGALCGRAHCTTLPWSHSRLSR